MDSDQLLLPPTSRLVHIGPPKTGTTSLQRALHRSREQMQRHGVHFAGPTMHPRLAARAVAGGGPTKGERPARAEDWTELVDEVRAAGDCRVILSSEFLSNADATAAARVVADLEGGPIHVVVTLRPLAKIAPSQWQQALQGGGVRVPYLEWLEEMFQRRYDEPVPLFWRRNAHGELVRRWAEVAGRENISVIVLDESDPGMLLRTFEGLLGLPDGILAPGASPANRSLTRGESEFLRLINEQFDQHKWRGAWSGKVHADVVRQGVVRRMKAGHHPLPEEPRLAMPDWAAQRAAQFDAETVQTIESLGVRVVGDLDGLGKLPRSTGETDAELKRMPLIRADVAALAELGAIRPKGKLNASDKVAAALAIAATCRSDAEGSTSTDVPLLPADVAARTVLATIEAGDSHQRLRDLPAIPSDVTARLLSAVSKSQVPDEPEGLDSALARRLAEGLGVRPRTNKPRTPPAPQPPEEPQLDLAPTADLAREVARRGRHSLRRRLRALRSSKAKGC